MHGLASARASTEQQAVTATARDQRLMEAWQRFQGGELTQAEAGARALVTERSDDADALHLLALVKHRQGQGAEAIGLFQTAVAARPQDGEIRNNQGCMLMELGRP